MKVMSVISLTQVHPNNWGGGGGGGGGQEGGEKKRKIQVTCTFCSIT